MARGKRTPADPVAAALPQKIVDAALVACHRRGSFPSEPAMRESIVAVLREMGVEVPQE